MLQKEENLDKKLDNFERIAKSAFAPLFFNEATLCMGEGNMSGACEYFIRCIDRALYENWETIINPALGNISKILDKNSFLEIHPDVITELKKNPRYFIIKKRFEEIIQKKNNNDNSSNKG